MPADAHLSGDETGIAGSVPVLARRSGEIGTPGQSAGIHGGRMTKPTTGERGCYTGDACTGGWGHGRAHRPPSVGLVAGSGGDTPGSVASFLPMGVRRRHHRAARADMATANVIESPDSAVRGVSGRELGGDGRAPGGGGLPGGREIIQEVAWLRADQDPERRSAAHHPADQEGRIILMTTGSYLQLSSGCRRRVSWHNLVLHFCTVYYRKSLMARGFSDLLAANLDRKRKIWPALGRRRHSLGRSNSVLCGGTINKIQPGEICGH